MFARQNEGNPPSQGETASQAKANCASLVTVVIQDAHDTPIRACTGLFTGPNRVVTDRCALIGGFSAKVVDSSGRQMKVLGIQADDSFNELVMLLTDASAQTPALLTVSNRTLVAGDVLTILKTHLQYEAAPAAQQEKQAVIAKIEQAPNVGQIITLEPPLTPALAGCPVIDAHGELAGFATTRTLNGQIVSALSPARVLTQFKKGEVQSIAAWSAANAPKLEDARTVPIELDGPLLEIAAWIKRDARECGKARIRLANHLKLNPGDGRAAFLFGLSYHREKKYAQAIPFFEQALRLLPEFSATPYFHGWALYYTEQLDAARMAFERYVRFKPEEADAFYALGVIDLDQSELDRAQLQFEKSMALFMGKAGNNLSDIAKCQARLGEIFERRGDSDRARELLQSAVDLHPDFSEAWLRLHLVLKKLGRETEAAKAHEQFLDAQKRAEQAIMQPK